jgi:hypothetical protein
MTGSPVGKSHHRAPGRLRIGKSLQPSTPGEGMTQAIRDFKAASNKKDVAGRSALCYGQLLTDGIGEKPMSTHYEFVVEVKDEHGDL